MKVKLNTLVLFFCLGFISFSQAQTTSKFHLPALTLNHFSFNSSYLRSLPQFIYTKDLTLKYQPAKLPFFCAMEEKSRNKFKVILKFRAGNDESYMKMIERPQGQ